MNKYIQYNGCKVFPNAPRSGRMTEEINSKGEIEKCCLGATDEPTEWSSICKECLDCPKYIKNVIGELGGTEE